MELILKILMVFGAVFLLLIMVANFLVKNYPTIPGDVYFQNSSISFKIPLTSAIVLTIVITLLFGYFGLG